MKKTCFTAIMLYCASGFGAWAQDAPSEAPNTCYTTIYGKDHKVEMAFIDDTKTGEHFQIRKTTFTGLKLETTNQTIIDNNPAFSVTMETRLTRKGKIEKEAITLVIQDFPDAATIFSGCRMTGDRVFPVSVQTNASGEKFWICNNWVDFSQRQANKEKDEFVLQLGDLTFKEGNFSYLNTDGRDWPKIPQMDTPELTVRMSLEYPEFLSTHIDMWQRKLLGRFMANECKPHQIENYKLYRIDTSGG